jgi:hypothetical protein
LNKEARNAGEKRIHGFLDSLLKICGGLRHLRMSRRPAKNSSGESPRSIAQTSAAFFFLANPRRVRTLRPTK